MEHRKDRFLRMAVPLSIVTELEEAARAMGLPLKAAIRHALIGAPDGARAGIERFGEFVGEDTVYVGVSMPQQVKAEIDARGRNCGLTGAAWARMTLVGCAGQIAETIARGIQAAAEQGEEHDES